MRNKTTTSPHLHGSAIDVALAVASVAQKADETLAEHIGRLTRRVTALEEKSYTDAYVQDVEDRLDAAHDELIAQKEYIAEVEQLHQAAAEALVRSRRASSTLTDERRHHAAIEERLVKDAEEWKDAYHSQAMATIEVELENDRLRTLVDTWRAGRIRG